MVVVRVAAVVALMAALGVWWARVTHVPTACGVDKVDKLGREVPSDYP